MCTLGKTSLPHEGEGTVPDRRAGGPRALPVSREAPPAQAWPCKWAGGQKLCGLITFKNNSHGL